MKETNIKEIRKHILLSSPIEQVWKAVSTSDGLASWWMENTLDKSAGENFLLHTGHFGDSPCRVTEWVPNELFAFDWGKNWHLRFELKELSPAQTELIVIHSGWDPEKTTEFGQPHTVVYSIMDEGWEALIHQKLPSVL